MAAKPNRDAATLASRGLLTHRAGRWEEARLCYERALELDPEHYPALQGLGVLATQMRDPARGVEFLQRAIALRPEEPRIRANLAMALRSLGRLDEALAAYEHALRLDGGIPELHFHHGVALRLAGQNSRAIESYRRAIELRSDYAEAYNNLGNLLYRLGEYECAERELARAIALQPGHAGICTSYGVALLALRRFEQALACFDAAISVEPGLAEAYANRGLALAALRRYDTALESFERATALAPEAPEHDLNRANVLREMRRYAAAVECLDRAIAHARGPTYARGMRIHLKMQSCDWEGLPAELAAVCGAIERGEAASPPFPLLAFSASPTLQRRSAEIWVAERCPPNPSLGPIAARPRRERLRIGYFSADFREHSVSILAAELFECHDRSRFEPIAFSYGPDTGDFTRRRLERAFDRFLDVEASSEREIAALSRNLEIDIAVDLGGYTQGARPGIFALRAAPVQVSYLGYLGTTGAPWMDYLIADPVIVPEAHLGHYSEAILSLPSFQVNDSSRPVSERVFTRAELSLPQSGFVFCCFNAPYKITPDTFDRWMRILGRVEGSVLFLFAGDGSAEANLRRAAAHRGIDPERLVFGEWLPPPEYRARFRAADLFLDTLPYNAGTTASDALWAGLPVLTLAGETFASRMGASLLTSIGLLELVATSAEQYEELALALATVPEMIAGIRTKLAKRRTSGALFDARRFVTHLETGFICIYERALAGLAPANLVVGPSPGRR